MKPFPEKVKEARAELNLSQAQLGQASGISHRAITDYERGIKKPRQAAMLRLAKALQVSVRFLSDDSCEDPMMDIEKDGYIEEARVRFGSKGARDIDELLSESTALFAGGELTQEQKDAFFEAIMTAYVTCKQDAKAKFGRKNS